MDALRSIHYPVRPGFRVVGRNVLRDPPEASPYMMDSILNLLFRCHHGRLSRPMRMAGLHGDNAPLYVTCLDCGKRFAYDWEEMRLGGAVKPPGPAPPPEPVDTRPNRV
jgi:hypothetical protein